MRRVRTMIGRTQSLDWWRYWLLAGCASRQQRQVLCSGFTEGKKIVQCGQPEVMRVEYEQVLANYSALEREHGGYVLCRGAMRINNVKTL
jgi:hypothetical protein